MPRRQFGTYRKTLPPRPPDELWTHPTRIHDPLIDPPLPEGRQQLIVSNLWLTDARHAAGCGSSGIFKGKRLLVKAQGLDLGLNGRRLMACSFFNPRRGRAAEDGTGNLSKLDKFFERVLRRIPRPGTFPLRDLIGVNFLADVVRGRRKIEDEWHPAAFFHVEAAELGNGVRVFDACNLFDDWDPYPPEYNKIDGATVFRPPELADTKI